MKRMQDNEGFLAPGGKRRLLASSLQAPTPSDSASPENTDAEMFDHPPQDDMACTGTICYGAVSLYFTLQE